jgi:hypothetical protein
VLQGWISDIASGLRRPATRKQLSEYACRSVDKATDYLDENQSRLHYDEALAQGLPIATGVEGACRHLDGMDITGARWGLARADSINSTSANPVGVADGALQVYKRSF